MSYKVNLLLQGNTVTAFQPSTGQQVKPINNKIYVLGDGVNITTNAFGNTVSASVNNNITLSSVTAGNVTVSGNTISTASGFNLNIAPVSAGKIVISYGSAGSVPLVDNTSEIQASNFLADGQVLIGETGSTPLVANLTAGSGITITQASGSITISADGSTSGNAGALKWSTQTWTGSGNRAYTAMPNNGYFANSNQGTISYANYYCPSYPIRYTMASSDQWELGDVAWFANRNKGNFSAQLLADQYFAYSDIFNSLGAQSPFKQACISSGELDQSINIAGNPARNYSRAYGVSLVIYIDSVNYSRGVLGGDGNVSFQQFSNVFFLANTMGAPSECRVNCLL